MTYHTVFAIQNCIMSIIYLQKNFELNKKCFALTPVASLILF